MTPQRRRLALAAALTPLLAIDGCATRPHPPGSVLAGRLALSWIGAQGAQTLTARFELTGDATRGELVLVTALGTTLATAAWQPGQARWTTAEASASYPDLEALALGAFGEALPLAAIVDWLRGRPWPQAPYEGEPALFVQLGWRVDARLREQGRIDASRPGEPAASLRVRLDPP